MRIQRGSSDLRDQLFDTLEGLASGSVSVSRALAIAKVAREINASVQSELIELRIMREAILVSGESQRSLNAMPEQAS